MFNLLRKLIVVCIYALWETVRPTRAKVFFLSLAFGLLVTIAVETTKQPPATTPTYTYYHGSVCITRPITDGSVYACLDFSDPAKYYSARAFYERKRANGELPAGSIVEYTQVTVR